MRSPPFERFMLDNGIRNIVHLPATDLVPHASFHVWLHSSWLAEHCGQGATIQAALDDAIARQERRAA